MKFNFLLFSCLTATILMACSNYKFTLNNQEINESAPLFSNFSVADTELKKCLQEHIADQRATSSESLQFLNCSHNEVQSLAGIEHFTGLRRIDMAHNQVVSISELLKLNDLVSVDLSGNAELNCEEYQQLKRLKPGLTLKGPSHCLKVQQN